MSLREQLTPEQFKAVFNAPAASAAYAASASGGVWEFIHEMFAAGKFIAAAGEDGGPGPYGPLVEALLAEMGSMTRDEIVEATISFEGGAQEDLRPLMRQLVADAVTLTAQMDGAPDYRRWLLESARKAVEASRGGFLGIGAAPQPIDAKEQAALDELEQILDTAG
jgi:hypothetical protein